LPGGVIPGATSNNAPSLASSRGLVFIAWTGTDNRLYVDNMDVQMSNMLPLGTSVPGAPTSPYGPSLAPDPNGSMLDIAWTGTDSQHHLNVNSMPYPGLTSV
jgi:hypothetical protein